MASLCLPMCVFSVEYHVRRKLAENELLVFFFFNRNIENLVLDWICSILVAGGASVSSTLENMLVPVERMAILLLRKISEHTTQFCSELQYRNSLRLKLL